MTAARRTRPHGASELRLFWTIVLPLSKPILAMVALFYAVTYWNEWFNSILFLTDPGKFPLPGHRTQSAGWPATSPRSPNGWGCPTWW